MAATMIDWSWSYTAAVSQLISKIACQDSKKPSRVPYLTYRVPNNIHVWYA